MNCEKKFFFIHTCKKNNFKRECVSFAFINIINNILFSDYEKNGDDLDIFNILFLVYFGDSVY